MADKWKLEGEWINSCNCDSGCPCLFYSDPTQGSCEALDAFQRDLGQAMARAGLGRWVDKSFLPHVTLLRDRRIVAEQPIAPVTWTVGGFTLIHSLLGRTQHIPLARWSLG